MSIENLSKTLSDGNVRLEPLSERHIEPLRAACALDREIWEIYPVSLLDENFDKSMELFHSTNNWVRFAVLNGDEVVGMSNFISADPNMGTVEIGGTYIAPSVRATGFNRAMKKLMIDHAFASGYRKVGFKVDTRNKRSMAAVLKLGAVQEGIMRQDRITWTGYIRDTAVFGLLASEWEG